MPITDSEAIDILRDVVESNLALWANERGVETMTDETGIRNYGPGKFDTILDEYVYSVTLDGGCDDEIGSVGENGEWFGLMRNGHTIFRDHDPLLETLNEAEQELLTSSAGVIVSENDQGFVGVIYFETEAELDLEWSGIVDSLIDAEDNDF